MAGAEIIDLRLNYEESCLELEVAKHEYIMDTFSQMEEDSMTLDPEKLTIDLAANNKPICQRKLEDNDVKALAHSLRESKNVVKLDLKYNKIGNDSAKYIADLLLANAYLEDLDMMSCDITEEGAAHLAKSLQENETLRILRLNSNKIGHDGSMHIAGALQINTGLEKLDVNQCDVKTGSFIAFITVLRANTTISTINLSSPLIFSVQEETIVHVKEMLILNKFLSEIHLAKMKITDFGAERLAEALYHNGSLKYLDVSCNHITRDGVRHFSKMLHHNTSLETLDLSFNYMEDEGAHCLAEGIEGNFSLNTLNVRNNKLHGDGVHALCESLRFNTSLERLFIWGNHSDEESVAIPLNNLLNSGRISVENIDIVAYTVDGTVMIAKGDLEMMPNYYTKPPQHRKKVTHPAVIEYRERMAKKAEEKIESDGAEGPDLGKISEPQDDNQIVAKPGSESDDDVKAAEEADNESKEICKVETGDEVGNVIDDEQEKEGSVKGSKRDVSQDGEDDDLDKPARSEPGDDRKSDDGKIDKPERTHPAKLGAIRHVELERELINQRDGFAY